MGCRFWFSWDDVKLFLRQIYLFRQLLVVVLTPVVLLPLALAYRDDPAIRSSMQCAYVLAIMIVYWSTLAIPIAITALLPMVFYPILSIARASDLAPQYMGESNLAFIAALIVVETIDQVGLCKRSAIRVLLTVGVSPRWVLMGFMALAAFTSMWLQHSVVTALMVPIVLSVSEELQKAIFGAWKVPEKPKEQHGRFKKRNLLQRFSMRKSVDVVAHSMGDQRFRDMVLLGVAYSSTIGGMSTLIGSSSNLIAKGQIDEEFQLKNCPSPVNFLSWMIFAFPMSVVFLCFAWFMLLCRYYGPMYALGCRPSPIDKYRAKIKPAIQVMYDELPPMGIRQYVVIGHIVFMVILMITRQLNTNPLIGWDLIAAGYAKESTSAVLVAISLYVFPISLPFRDDVGTWHLPETAVNWEETSKSIPFSVIILVGGAEAAAYGAEQSGLDNIMSDYLFNAVSSLQDWAAMCIFVIIFFYLSEILSATACVSIMMPVLRKLAGKRGDNPLFYMLPTTVASSLGFMFPVATAPNAEVFHAGTLRLIDMIAIGFFMNLVGIGVVIGATMSYGYSYFNFGHAPWTKSIDALNQTIYTC